jgi:hypothetical protein
VIDPSLTVCLRSAVIDREPAPNQGQEAAREATPGALARAVEWVWQGRALAAKRAALPEPGERVRALALRARVNANVAEKALKPAEPAEPSKAAVAAELYRQSAYWSLCALSPGASDTLGANYSETAWGALDDSLLARAAGGSERLDPLRTNLYVGSFVYFAELPEPERELTCRELARLAEILLARLTERGRAFRALYLQRAGRLALLALVALTLALAALWVRDARDMAGDLAVGKAWRASSRFEDGGCISPEQHCAGNTGYFFQTRAEYDPWIEFDLGAPRSISRVRIENRKDCCAERAKPLTIEVSLDGNQWQTVAQRKTEFNTWRAAFSPVEARYVRITLHGRTYFHLARVRILP